MGPEHAQRENLHVGPPGGFGPPGGYGPPPGGGGYGPPPGGGFGPPGGPPGGFGPPGGPPGGFGPPGGPPGYGPPPGYNPPGGYGPPGYRPAPPKSGGGGGKLAIGCLVIFLLAGGAAAFAVVRAKNRTQEVFKQYEEDSARIAKVVKTIDAAREKKGGIDQCVAAVTDRLTKLHAAKDDPPSTIPAGATLVCDTTSWQTGCHTAPVLVSNTAFSTVAACNDTSVTTLAKLSELESKKPYPRDANIDDWEKDVKAAIAAHEAAQASIKAPDMIAALASTCEATAVESFVDNSTGIHRQLEANSCQVSITWADASGNVVGRLKATGKGSPPDSARKSMTLSDSEMDAANATSLTDALDDGYAQIQKKIDLINKKAGAPSKGSPTPAAPAPKAAPVPAKTPTPAPKGSAPAPKGAAPAPKSPAPKAPAPPPKK